MIEVALVPSPAPILQVLNLLHARVSAGRTPEENSHALTISLDDYPAWARGEPRLAARLRFPTMR